jgi:glycerol-3-phosphate dehydrogenase
LRDGTDDNLALILAELHFCIDQELVQTAADFFVRRTGLMFFDIQWVKTYYRPVLDVLRPLMNWSEDEYARQLSEVEKLLAEAQLKTIP